MHVSEKAVLICRLINELPLTKDGRASSHKQYLHRHRMTWACTSLSFLQAQWAGWRSWGACTGLGGSKLPGPAVGRDRSITACLAHLTCLCGIYSVKEHQTPLAASPHGPHATAAQKPAARVLSNPPGEGAQSPLPTPKLTPRLWASPHCRSHRRIPEQQD